MTAVKARIRGISRAVSVAVLVAALCAVSPASAGAGTTTPVYFELLSVSCPTDNFCMTVGHFWESGTPSLGLAYRWDGTAWQVMPTVAPQPGFFGIGLSSVSCASATFCVALGFEYGSNGQRLIAERWNGTSWRFMGIQLPGRTNNRIAVSCVAPSSCVAVGTHLASGRAVGNCSNSGSECRPVTWQLVGNTFVLRPAAARPFPYALLNGVSCAAADNCTAVGNETVYYHPLAEHWDGHRWSWVGPLPYPHTAFRDLGPDLEDISCPAPRSCVAVGSAGTDGDAFIENRRAGGAWYYGLPQPRPDYEGGASRLQSVSCSVFQRCAAVGSSMDRGDQGHGFLAWRDFRTGGFVVSETTPIEFSDVACPTSSCVYVGTDISNPSPNGVIYRGGQHPTAQMIPPPPAS
jgi:hypothetical protein